MRLERGMCWWSSSSEVGRADAHDSNQVSGPLIVPVSIAVLSVEGLPLPPI